MESNAGSEKEIETTVEKHVKGVKQVVKRQIDKKHARKDIAHATKENFTRTSLCVGLAWIMSQAIYQTATYAICQTATYPDGVLADGIESFMIRTLYAIACSIILPIIGWFVRKEVCEGDSPVRNWRKLQNTYLKMNVAWSWKDWVSTTNSVLVTNANMESIFSTLILAVSFTLFIAVAELTPFYRNAREARTKAATSNEPVLEDTPFRRVLLLPDSLALACGYAWNLVFMWPVNSILDAVRTGENGMTPGDAEEATFHLFLMVFYFMFLCALSVVLTVLWNRHEKQARRASKELEDENDEDKLDANDILIATLRLEALIGNTVVKSISFVYGWALLNTLNVGWFNWYVQCTAVATGCTYQSNLLFSILTTYFFAKAIVFYRTEERRSEWGKAYVKLQVTAMSLTVGWAWKNFFNVLITVASRNTNRETTVLWFWAAWLIMNLLAAIVWNWFVQESNVAQREVKKEKSELERDLESSSSEFKTHQL